MIDGGNVLDEGQEMLAKARTQVSAEGGVKEQEGRERKGEGERRGRERKRGRKQMKNKGRHGFYILYFSCF